MKKLAVPIASFFFLLPLLHASAKPAPRISAPPAKSSPVISSALPHLLTRVARAKDLLKNERARLMRNKIKRNGRWQTVWGRSVPIALYDPLTDAITVIRAELSLENEKGEVEVFKVTPDTYSLQKVGGNGVNSLFAAYLGGRKQIVLAWKFAFYPSGKESIYTPYADDFSTPAIIQVGKEYLVRQILAAQDELRVKKIYSRAMPGHLVADLFSPQMLFNIAIIEHIDHDEYKPCEPGEADCDDAKRGTVYTGEKVLIQFALNGSDTFNAAVSHAGALCLAQIMRGTYQVVRGMYPEAHLPRDPEVAACGSHKTAIQVAYLVLDSKLAALGDDFIKTYLNDPEMYGIYLAVAYNGGEGRARRLFAKVAPGRLHTLLNDLFSLFRRPHGFWEKRIMFPETWKYIKEYHEIGGEFPVQKDDT